MTGGASPARVDYSGRVVRIADHVTHAQVPDFGGSEFRVEGYWDEITGGSWMFADGNPACMVYAIRTGVSAHFVPVDNEVLYGKVGSLGHLVHVTEIEEIPESGSSKEADDES